MKKIVALFSILVLLLVFAMPTFAAGYAPSVTNKGAPQLSADAEGFVGSVKTPAGETLSREEAACLKVTPVAKADELPAEAKVNLLKAFDEIKNSKKLSDLFKDLKNADKLVVRDLLDIAPLCENTKKLAESGNVLDLTFDLSVKADVNVIAMLYVNGTWKELKTKNNGNGTVTAYFNELGAVAFLVPASTHGSAPDTGDASHMGLWIALLAVSSVALVTLAVVAAKRSAQK